MTDASQTNPDGSPRSESLSPSALRGLVVRSPMPPDGVVGALETASRRGKLPGFRSLPPPPEPGARRVCCDVFGSPYDRDLIITILPARAHQEGARHADPAAPTGSTLRFESRLRRKFPAAVAIVMALAIWPGVWMTDSLLVSYFSWYPRAGWVTPAWYIPLTLLAIPALWKQYRKSESGAAVEAASVVDKIARLVNATSGPTTMRAVDSASE
ncbi:MAG: hypothetical protein ACTS3F_03535 [Phycisphaerales bacterium]